MTTQATTVLASSLFKLDNFSHAALFDDQKAVWSVLGSTIQTYLATFGDHNRIDGQVADGAILDGHGIIIEEGAVVEATAYIKGPVFIGAGTQVRHGAYVRGCVITGKNCVIGHATEVKNSVFLDDAKAGHFNYVGDSLLGNNVNLGAGTKLANLKVFAGNVMLTIDQQRVDSGLRKFGAILGDGTEMGCNSVSYPGTVLAAKSVIYPCCRVKGVHRQRLIQKEP